MNLSKLMRYKGSFLVSLNPQIPGGSNRTGLGNTQFISDSAYHLG